MRNVPWPRNKTLSPQEHPWKVPERSDSPGSPSWRPSAVTVKILSLALVLGVLMGAGSAAAQPLGPLAREQISGRRSGVSTAASRGSSTALEAGDPILADSGSFSWSLPLLNLGGVLPLRFDLTYHLSGSGEWGQGFFFSFHKYLEHLGGTEDALIKLVSEETADSIVATGNANATEWTPQPSPRRLSIKAAAGISYLDRWHFVLDHRTGLVSLFGGKKMSGPRGVLERLYAVMDRNGNRLTYEYPADFFLIKGSDLPSAIYEGAGAAADRRFRLDTEDPPAFDDPAPGYRSRLTQVVEQLPDGAGGWTDGRRVSLTWNSVIGVLGTHRLLSAVTDPLGAGVQLQQPLLSWNTEEGTFESPVLTRITRPRGNVPVTQVVEVKALGSPDQTAPRVTSQTDGRGNTTTLAYDPSSHRVTVRRPDNSTVVFDHYGEFQGPKAFQDGAGNSQTFEQNATFQTTSLTDRMGTRSQVTYHEPSGKIASYTDGEGHTTTLTYEERKQTFAVPGVTPVQSVEFSFYDLRQVTYPDGAQETYTRDPRGNVTAFTDRNGKVWTYTYNEDPAAGRLGQLLSGTNPEGGVETFTYNPDGTLASWKESDLSQPVTFAYDVHRRRVRTTYPDGTFTSSVYDAGDRLTETRDRTGLRTTFTYDANGNLVAVVRDPGGANQTYTYSYDSDDQLGRLTDPGGHATTLAYAWHGGLRETTLPDGAKRELSYGPSDWITSLKDEGGKTWHVARDKAAGISGITTPTGKTLGMGTNGLGFAASLTDPRGKTLLLERDPMQRVVAVTDQLGRKSEFTYDGLGHLVALRLPLVGEVTYGRNGLGLVERITDQAGHFWRFTHTPGGRLLSLQDPTGKLWTFAYDVNGRLRELTFPDGSTEVRTYDGEGRLLERQCGGGPRLTFTYDALGRLVETASVPVALTYDEQNRVHSVTVHGTVFSSTYDLRGRLATLAYGNVLTVTYTYDLSGRVARVEDGASGAWVAFARNDDGDVIQITRSNGVTTTFTRNANNQITKIVHGDATVELGRDDAGQITSLLENLSPDVASVLLAERRPLSCDAAGELTTPGYSFDLRGRRIADPTRRYSWDGADRLGGYGEGDLRVSFDYTALGDLASRADGSEDRKFCPGYALPGHPRLAELVGGALERCYVYGPDGGLLYAVETPQSSPEVRFFHFNHLGSTLFLTDGAGEVTDRYVYAPYGGVLRHQGPSTQPFTFVGEAGVVQEGSSGLYGMRARWYDASTGRFLTRDPLWPDLTDPRSLSPYTYAAGNPVSLSDPSGLAPIQDLHDVLRKNNAPFYINSLLEQVDLDATPPGTLVGEVDPRSGKISWSALGGNAIASDTVVRHRDPWGTDAGGTYYDKIHIPWTLRELKGDLDYRRRRPDFVPELLTAQNISKRHFENATSGLGAYYEKQRYEAQGVIDLRIEAMMVLRAGFSLSALREVLFDFVRRSSSVTLSAEPQSWGCGVTGGAAEALLLLGLPFLTLGRRFCGAKKSHQKFSGKGFHDHA